MNKGQVGSVIYFQTGFDMSGNTSLSMTLTKPDGSTLTKTPTLGTVAKTVNGVSLVANEYVSYTTVSGDIDQTGTWSAQVTYTDSSQTLPSDLAYFKIGG